MAIPENIRKILEDITGSAWKKMEDQLIMKAIQPGPAKTYGGTTVEYIRGPLPLTATGASSMSESPGLYPDLLPSVFYANREEAELELKARGPGRESLVKKPKPNPETKKAKDLSKFKNSKREIDF